MVKRQLPDNSPVVNVAWIADRLGITPGRVRRYIAPDGPLPRLTPNIEGLSEYAFMREQAEAWIAAYRAAPKLGRRGDGSKQRRAKEWEYEAELGAELRDMKETGPDGYKEYSGYEPDDD